MGKLAEWFRDGRLWPYLGYAFFLPWFAHSEAAVLWGVDSEDFLLLKNVAIAVDFIALIVISCLSSVIGSLRDRRGIAGLFAVLVPLSSVVFACVGLLEPSVLPAFAVGCVVGLARAGFALLWMEAFSQLEFRKVCALFPLATLLGIALRGLVGVVPSAPIRAMVCAGCGLAGVLLSLRAAPSDWSNEGRANSDGQWSFPIKPIMLMGMYAFAYAFVLNASTTGAGESVAPVPGHAVICLIIVGVALYSRNGVDIKPLYVLSLPVMAVALLCILSCFPFANSAGPFFGGIAFYGFSLFTNLLLFNISFRYGVNSLWLFGFARAARVVGTGCVGLLGGAAASGGAQMHDGVAAVALVALIVASSLLLTDKDYATTWGIAPVKSSRLPAPAALTEADRYARLSRCYGLTRREEEVCALLVRGCTIADVERELVVSNGTARNHIQHVYKKLGVHSKAEVQESVARFMAEHE